MRSANYNVTIGATEKDVQDRLDWIRDHYAPYLTAEQLERRVQQAANDPLAGTPEQLVERLTELASLGMSYAILNFAEIAYDRSGLELFVKEVAPALAAV